MTAALPTDSARHLLMQGQGLLDDPSRRPTLPALARAIQRMGFVQLDSINVIERAHHLTLATRFDAYGRHHLQRLSEEKRGVFEHWTHDASLIPIELLPSWKHRFSRSEKSKRMGRWMKQRMGTRPRVVLREVLERVRSEGPLMSRDFESSPHGSSGWWNWKPQKAALEYLWHIGKLAVTARRDFHKVYDLIERTFPDSVGLDPPSEAEYEDWACASALERLGFATPAEIAGFWAAVPTPTATRWCRTALREGRIREVTIADARGARARPAFAIADYERRLARVAAPPRGLRLLCPFDPVLRDRARLVRLFGFDYRFEAFVPRPKRRHGYYVMPILEGERFIGRLDPKLLRDRAHIELRHLSLEAGVRLTRARRTELDDALARLARLVGAESWDLPGRARPSRAKSGVSIH